MCLNPAGSFPVGVRMRPGKPSETEGRAQPWDGSCSSQQLLGLPAWALLLFSAFEPGRDEDF